MIVTDYWMYRAKLFPSFMFYWCDSTFIKSLTIYGWFNLFLFLFVTLQKCNTVPLNVSHWTHNWHWIHTQEDSHPEPQAALCALIICCVKCACCFVNSVYLSALVYVYTLNVCTFAFTVVPSVLFVLSTCLLMCECTCSCAGGRGWYNEPLCE